MSQVNAEVCLPISGLQKAIIMLSSAHQKIHIITLDRQEICFANLILLRSINCGSQSLTLFSLSPPVNMVIILAKDLVVMEDSSL